MPSQRDGRSEGAGHADYRRRLIMFAVADGAITLLGLLPALVYLFVLDNGLSEHDLMLYGIALIALKAAVTGLLLWTFRIFPGPQADGPDAR